MRSTNSWGSKRKKLARLVVDRKMSITSSVIIEDQSQVDGRRHVRERHTDHLGVFHFVSYVAASGFDATTALAATAVSLVTQLREREILRNMAIALGAADGVTSFQHSTGTQNATALRELYKISTKEAALRLGWYVWNYGLTDAQYKNFWGINDAQLVLLKTKLSAQAQAYEDMLLEAGE